MKTQGIGVLAAGRLISAEELAEHLQIPVTTIYQWRHRGEGPKGMRIGRFLRFDPGDVAAWLHDKQFG